MKKITAITFCLFFLIFSVAVLSQKKGSKTKRAAKNIPAGFGSLNWGTLISKAKGNVLGKIVFSDNKKIIKSRDGDIDYLYGFFYVDPAVVKKASPSATLEGKLFYVSIGFPYLSMDDVKKKIEGKYGSPNGENVKNNQGAMLWDSEKTTIVMWIDEYEKKPFCRKITYVGKEIAKEINEYQKKVFNRKELEILEKLSP